MKIKISDSVKAMAALNELYAKPIEDTKTVLSLYALRRNLMPLVEFHREREKQLIEMNHGTLTGDQVHFEKQEDFQKYMLGRDELANTEMEFKWAALKIKIADVAPLSMKILDGLSGLIDFVEG